MLDYRNMIATYCVDELAKEAGKLINTNLETVAHKFWSECFDAMEKTERLSEAWGHNKNLGSPSKENQGWAEDSWRSWFKVRAIAISLYPNVGKMAEKFPGVSLTVGFPFIEETQDHIDVLKSGVIALDPEIANNTARSKIGSTGQIVEPIDRAAARVTGVKTRYQQFREMFLGGDDD